MKGKNPPPPRSKRCGNCNDKLPQDHGKPFCYRCIQKLSSKETSQVMRDFLAVQSEMLSTLQSIKTAIAPKAEDREILSSREGTSSQEGFSDRGQKTLQGPPSSVTSGVEEFEDPEESEEDSLEEGVDTDADSQDSDSPRASSHLFPVEDMGQLLRAIYASEDIPEPPVQASARDKMYRGLGKPQSRVFPVHQALKEVILREWKDPERKVLRLKTWKRRFPFGEEEEQKFFKTPKLDAALSQVSKKSDLSFEDSGNLKDQMDRRAEALLRRAWDSNAAAMAPALASACVARNVDAWLGRLSNHVSKGSDSKEITDSLEIIGKAVAYLADAAVESVRNTAKSAALLNSARRAVWVKSWEGDHMSRSRLCGLPFEGSQLFGPGLDQVLSRSAEKGKKFPVKAKVARGRKFFRPSVNQGQFKGKKDANRRWGKGKSAQKGSLLFSGPKDATKQSK